MSEAIKLLECKLTVTTSSGKSFRADINMSDKSFTLTGSKGYCLFQAYNSKDESPIEDSAVAEAATKVRDFIEQCK